MYGREVDGQMLTFGVSGKLILNNLVMFDDQTDSEWSQAYGTAISGPLEGTELDLVASRLMSWQAWRVLYPDTLVLDKRGLYRRDNYDTYYTDPSAGILGRRVRDFRLDLKDLVLGVEIGTAKRAYAYDDLAEAPIVNDTLGGVEIVVIHEPEAGFAAAWSRLLDDEAYAIAQGPFGMNAPDVLTFERASDAQLQQSIGNSDTAMVGSAPWGPLMRDRETGSIWSASAGEAIAGPLQAATLIQIPTTPSFWFAWADLFPDTSVWGGVADAG